MLTQTNNRRITSRLLLTAAFVGCTLVAGLANAANLTWDAAGGGGAITNGAGTWLGAGLWNNAGAVATWASGDDANFAGPATAGGAVTLASPTTVNSLTFSPSFTGTYTLGTITYQGGPVAFDSGTFETFVNGDQAFLQFTSAAPIPEPASVALWSLLGRACSE